MHRYAIEFEKKYIFFNNSLTNVQEMYKYLSQDYVPAEIFSQVSQVGSLYIIYAGYCKHSTALHLVGV